MLSDTVRMITSTREESIKLFREHPEIASQNGFVPQFIRFQTNVAMRDMDAVENARGEHLAYMGREFLATYMKSIRRLCWFNVAWGYEVATNPEVMMDHRVEEKSFWEDGEEGTEPDHIAHIIEIVSERAEKLMAENELDLPWMHAYFRQTSTKALDFLEDKINRVAKKFTDFSTPEHEYSRSRAMLATELVCFDMYQIGVRLGPAMKDLEEIAKIDLGDFEADLGED